LPPWVDKSNIPTGGIPPLQGWEDVNDGYDPANESHLVDDSVSMLGAVADHARDSRLAVETEGRIARAK
jgi:hypothetical protein